MAPKKRSPQDLRVAMNFPSDPAAVNQGTASRLIAGTLLDAVMRHTEGPHQVPHPHLLGLLGLEIKILDGESAEQHRQAVRTLYDAWSQLAKWGFITGDELATALTAGSVQQIFVAAVESTAHDCQPLWTALVQSQAALPLLPRLAFTEAAAADLDALRGGIQTEDAVVDMFFMDVEPRWLRELVARKDEGNARFAAKQYDKAIECYAEALDVIGPAIPKRLWNLAAILHSNSAQCHLSTENWNGARRSAIAALRCDPANTKAAQRKQLAEEKLMSHLGGIEKEARTTALKESCSLQ